MTTTIRWRVILAAAILTVATAACTEHAFNGVRIKTPLSKSTAAWQRIDGTPYNIADSTAGHVTLLYFGYTHCPDKCPMQLAYVGHALETLGPDTASRIRVLVVTLDPARDTGAVFSDWLHAFHPGFIGLRGPLTAVDSEVARLGLAPPPVDSTKQLETDPAHAAAIVAYGRDGLAHFLYPAETNANAYVYDLRKLLRDSVP